jgi:N-acetyl-gamma-glutamyl-phosphate reductase
MTRGLLATCRGRLATEAGTADVIDALRQRYAGERFIRVLGDDELPQTKRLSGTNGAEVTARVDNRSGTVLAFAALDNLGKGAAGQALQNANLMLGLDEGTGLDQPGMMP